MTLTYPPIACGGGIIYSRELAAYGWGSYGTMPLQGDRGIGVAL